MKSLNNFLLENELLCESLNTPVDFYATDDTQPPNQFYVAFDVDGTDYGASIVASKYNKVFILDFYRIVNVKKRGWSFKSKTHVRKCLSTVLRFVEATLQFIQSKTDAIIIELPKTKDSSKYVKFLEMVSKKSKNKKMEVVPFSKKTDKAGNYLFLVRKGKKLDNILTTAAFWKHFDFLSGGVPVTSKEMVDKEYDNISVNNKNLKDEIEAAINKAFEDSGITEPKKYQKPNVSTTPSEFEKELSSTGISKSEGQETVDSLDDIIQKAKIGITIKDSETPDPDDDKYNVIIEKNGKFTYDKNLIRIPSNRSPGDSKWIDIELFNLVNSGMIRYSPTKIHVKNKMMGEIYVDNKIDGIPAFAFIEHLVPEGLEKVKQYGFDPQKIDISNFSYVVKQNISKFGTGPLADEILKQFTMIGNDINAVAKAFAKSIRFPKSDAAIFVRTLVKNRYIISNDPMIKSKDSEKSSNYSESIRQLLRVESPAFSAGNDTSPFFTKNLPWTEKLENSVSKIEEIYSIPGAEKFKNNFDSIKYSQGIRKYSGSSAAVVNRGIRDIYFEDSKLDDISPPSSKLLTKDLLYVSESCVTSDREFWVYRNDGTPKAIADKYVIGEEIVFPSLMSTTVHSDMALSNGGYCRFKIFMTKGSLFIPLFENSNHPGEDEIVLPAGCVFKVMDIIEITPNKKGFVLVYTGNKEKEVRNKILGLAEHNQSWYNNEVLTEGNKKMKNPKEYTTEEIEKMTRDERIKIFGYDPGDKWSFGGMGTPEQNAAFFAKHGPGKIK